MTAVRVLQTGVDRVTAATLNRPLGDVLSGSGYSADGSDFAGFVCTRGMPDGSVSAPGLPFFASEPTTGLYRSAATHADFTITGTRSAFVSKRAVGDGYINGSNPPLGGILGVYGASANDFVAIMPYSFGMSFSVRTSDASNQAFEFHVWNATSAAYTPVLYGSTVPGGQEVQIRKKTDTNSIRFVYPDSGDPFIATEQATTNLAIQPTGDLSFIPASALVNHRSGTGGSYPEYRLFGNYVDASNYDRIRFGYDNSNSRYFLSGDALGSQLLRDFFVGTGTSLGTNALGKDLILAPGTGTGSSSGGKVRIQYASAGSSGASANTLADAWYFDSAIGSSTGGSFLAGTDGGPNIGTPTTNRPSSVWAKVRVSAPSLIMATQTVSYSTSITISATSGSVNVITATDGNAFTINAPTSPTDGQILEIAIRNTSGGALGTVTWNAVFKMAAWTSPATGNSRSITFRYNGTNWVEKSRTTVDVPN